MQRRLLLLIAGLLATGALAATATAGSGGVTGPAFYVHGDLYRTVATPADLPANAPDKSFDTIYEMFGAQAHNVATAAPGDTDYNGGRWMVHGVTFGDYDAALGDYDANGSGDFDSAEELEAAIAGHAATDIGVIRLFVCPVIPVPGHGH